MPCTYNSGTNTIQVTGYTQAVPCNFTDIYDADVAGSWGVVSRQGTNQFLFDAHLDIGDASTATWFADINKSITYPGTSTFIKITNNASFRLGEVYDAVNRLTRYGCFLTSTGTLQNIIAMYYSCQLELYSTVINSHGGQLSMNNQGSNSNIHKIWNVIWRGHSPAATQGIANVDIYNVRMEHATSGILSIGSQDKITISSQTTYGGLLASLPDGTIINGYDIYGTSYDWLVLWCPSISLYFDNCYIHHHGDAWVFMFSGSSGCVAYRRYDFEARVVDKDGNSISGATIEIRDLGDNVVVNATTSDDGYLNLDYGTASSGTATTLVDSSKSWTPNEYNLSKVKITSGTGAGQIRTITGNTATALTVGVAWTTQPDATSKYYIYPIKLNHGYFPSSNTEVWQTPHKIKVSKTGYNDYETEFTVEKAENWIIALGTGGGGGGESCNLNYSKRVRL